MGSTEDACVVCAEPLEWTGYGPCGHKEACSRCVTRLRFVLRDKRCVVCQQECPTLYLTRFNGDFTARVTAEQFGNLPAREKEGELLYLEEVEGYFDDPNHFERIKGLCSYTHPITSKDTQVPKESFRSLRALRQHIEKEHGLLFCDICLYGRKVFVCEQHLYTKPDLHRHMVSGDSDGPLAKTSFRGHPLCRFCRRRFNDSNDLYLHMERQHEHCFICRKQRPDSFVYYRDYRELEGHFNSIHYPCAHATCLEKKFVVFAAEDELKRHIAAEHGDELKMTKAQRREAMTIPVQLQYRSRNGDTDDGGGSSAQSRRGSSSRTGNGRMKRQPNERFSAFQETITREETVANGFSDPIAADDTRTTGEPVTFDIHDFPSVLEATTPVVRHGNWISAASGSGANLGTEDFPELPSLSKSALRRQKSKQKNQESMANRLRETRHGARVINTAGPTIDQRSRNAALNGTGRLENTLGSSRNVYSHPDSSIMSGAPGPLVRESDLNEGRHAGIQALTLSKDHNNEMQLPKQQHRGSTWPAAVSADSSITAGNTHNLDDDFPSLTITKPRTASRSGAPAAAAVHPPPDGTAAAHDVKSANKVLMEKLKARLDQISFEQFRAKSHDYMKLLISAEEYHRTVQRYKLLDLMPELIGLCPSDELKTALTRVHVEYLSSPAAHKVTENWVPPEAVLEALKKAHGSAFWSCTKCTFLNKPTSCLCEVCGTSRPTQQTDKHSREKHTRAPTSLPTDDAQYPQLGASSRGQAKLSTGQSETSSSSTTQSTLAGRWAQPSSRSNRPQAMDGWMMQVGQPKSRPVTPGQQSKKGAWATDGGTTMSQKLSHNVDNR